MAYRYGDRNQIQLLPQSIEDYVGEDDPVRAYDAFVESLDLNKLGIEIKEDKVGNPEYEPRTMIKLLVYGYSYGLRSSRKLERAVYHNIAFMWLMGGLKPDHKTIARFRKDHRNELKNILKQCAHLCIKLNLIEGNTLFLDGSKIRGNASIQHTWTKQRCEKSLKHIDKRIEEILTESEAIDEAEAEHGSLVKLEEELKDKQVLKKRVEGILQELREENRDSKNTTDCDCVKFKSRQGSHAGYNGQIVVDEKHGLIVSSDVVSESTDINQFAEQIDNANTNLGKKCTTACADAGYSDTKELKKIDEQKITVIVPSKMQAHDRVLQPFDKENFFYDAVKDCYICPEGHELIYSSLCKIKNHLFYRITNKNLCHACKHFGICTKSKDGRRIRRLMDEETKIKLEKQYNEEDSQAIYKVRKQKIELVFGHIKRNLGVSAFLLRGLDGVKAEMSIVASCFNITRMINIMGVRGLLQGSAAKEQMLFLFGVS